MYKDKSTKVRENIASSIKIMTIFLLTMGLLLSNSLGVNYVNAQFTDSPPGGDDNDGGSGGDDNDGGSGGDDNDGGSGGDDRNDGDRNDGDRNDDSGTGNNDLSPNEDKTTFLPNNDKTTISPSITPICQANEIVIDGKCVSNQKCEEGITNIIESECQNNGKLESINNTVDNSDFIALGNSPQLVDKRALQPDDPICELEQFKDTYACNKELPPPTMPDLSCKFDSSQEHCKATSVGCPDEIDGISYNMNDDEECFPDVPCPYGTHWVEEDESGQCYHDDEGCPESNMILIGGGCRDLDCNMNKDHPICSSGPGGPTTNPGGPTTNPGNPEFANTKIIETVKYNTISTNVYNEIIQPAILGDCSTINESIPLSSGTIEPNGIRILAYFDVCDLLSGSIITNIPSNSNIKIMAGKLGNTVASEMVVLNKIPVNNGGLQNVYLSPLTDPITGQERESGLLKTIYDVDTVFLLNDDDINTASFSEGDSVGININYKPPVLYN